MERELEKGFRTIEREEAIKTIIREFRYTREEAINILNGFNPDGTPFEQLPF